MTQRKKGPEPELARVTRVIAGLALTGAISLESVARHLGTTPRTLQRRLNQHGVGFWTLVERSRFGIAGALLRETDLKVQDIAAATGYSTPSAFARAFVKWSGRSPSAYRSDRADPAPGTSEWREMGGKRTSRPLTSKGQQDMPEES